MKNLLPILNKNYTFEKEIGRGGMGTVYLASDKNSGLKVAIKVLSVSPENVENFSNEEIILRFQREATSIAKLSHTNIVNIFYIGEENKKYFMVMEYLEGKSLSELLEVKKKLPPILAINIGIQMCKALQYSHENGIIHRDIKPANIILSRKGIAKLTDFGIAQFSDEQTKLTRTGSLLGSILYMPPEQLEDSSNIDHRVDIYSLGVTIYQLISGVLPFTADTLTQLFLKVFSGKPQKLSSYFSDIPVEIDQIIEKALFKSAGGRYQTAKEMEADLSKLFYDLLLAKENPGYFFTEDFIKSLFDGISPPIYNTTPKINKEISNSVLRRKIINKTITRILNSNYTWISDIIEDWETIQVLDLSIQELFERVMQNSIKGIYFSGAIIIDKNIFLFVYKGYFVGAIDTENDIIGNQVFQILPKKPDMIELKVADEARLSSPVIISSILDVSGEIVHKNLDSSTQNLFNLVDNLSSSNKEPFNGYVSCFSENNTYYYGFFNGEQVFAVSSNNTDDNSFLNLKNLVTNQNIIFSAYKVCPSLSEPSVNNLLKKSTLYLKYRQKDKVNLNKIAALGNEPITKQIIDEARNNTELVLDLHQQGIINILDKEIDLAIIVKNSEFYNFAWWLLNEYFFQINSSGNTNSLRFIYNWIPAIDNLRFFESLQGEDGNYYQYTIVFRGKLNTENFEKVLFVTRFGKGSIEDIDEFIEDTIQVKKKLAKTSEVGGAFYISLEEYSEETLKLFHERTFEPDKLFGIVVSLNKYKGFVKMGFGKGFHLNLIVYKSEEKYFNVIAPKT